MVFGRLEIKIGGKKSAFDLWHHGVDCNLVLISVHETTSL